MPEHEVVFGFGAHTASTTARSAEPGPAGRRRRARPLLAVGPPLRRRPAGRVRHHRVRPRPDRAHLRLRQRDQPAHAPRPHAGAYGHALSALSGGRFVLGIGAGGRGTASPHGRAAVARRSGRGLRGGDRLVRQLSGGGHAGHPPGPHYRVHRIEPAPVAAPPVWTGSVGPKSLAATGRVADGWIPGHAADWLSDRYRESRPVIDEAALRSAAIRARSARSSTSPGRITDRPLDATRDHDGRWIGGSADQWVEELTDAVLDHGASGFMLFSPSGGTPEPATLARWAREIAPAVREATLTGAARAPLSTLSTALRGPCSARPTRSSSSPRHRRAPRPGWPRRGRWRTARR